MPDRIFRGRPATGKKILVVGDVMLDHYVSGGCTRISPEAPVPVVQVKNERFVLGGAANVAANVKATGATTICIGMCGMDQDKTCLESLLEEIGVRACLVPDPGMRTTRKTRVVAHGQQIVRCDYETGCWNASRASKRRMAALLKDHLRDADAVIVSDYDKGVCQPMVMKLIAASGAPWVVDPKRPWTSRYPGAALLTPNAKEASTHKIHVTDPVEAAKAARLMCERTKARAVAVTIGHHGACLAQNGSSIHLPVAPVEVFDPTGAGDVFAAFATLGFAIGLEAQDAVRFANAAASVSVGRHGATIVSWEEAVESMRKQPDPVLLS